MVVSVPVVVGVVIVGLFVWLVVRQRGIARAEQAALEQFGFHPCPDKKPWLEQTIASIERNTQYTYTVQEPRRLDSEPAVYFYTKLRSRDLPSSDESALGSQEILFPVRRKSNDGVALMVKPSSLKSGFATDLISVVPGAAWDIQPEGLEKIELPVELLDSNVVVALGPRGASLLDLVDGKTLEIVKGLGDAGGMFVQFRDNWCSVTGMSRKDFKVEDLINRIRPLLRFT